MTGEKPHVLMVDDDDEFRMIVRDWINHRYDFSELPSGEGLLEEMAEVQPDVVIMDVRMPGPSGFKLCQAMRADARFHSVPVLFLTASKDDVDFVRSLRVGGTAFLAKPVDRKDLLYKLKELLLTPV
ncbi:MAG: response regulator [Elusimicrobia bacterium]|nr:response regulator [Elusimicrobiota bacterium]